MAVGWGDVVDWAVGLDAFAGGGGSCALSGAGAVGGRGLMSQGFGPGFFVWALGGRVTRTWGKGEWGLHKLGF